MKDPGSVQFRNVTCEQGWMGNIPIAGLKSQFGYYFTGEVNGKVHLVRMSVLHHFTAWSETLETEQECQSIAQRAKANMGLVFLRKYKYQD